MVIACLCTDGFFRKVTLTPKQAHEVSRKIIRMNKDGIHLDAKPVFLILQPDVAGQDAQPPSQAGSLTSGVKE